MLSLYERLAARGDLRAAREERSAAHDKKIRDEKLLDLLAQSPEVRAALQKRRDALLPQRQEAAVALRAAPAKHAGAIKRTADARNEAERVAVAAEHAVTAARTAAWQARQLSRGAELALDADIANARRQLERTADPRIATTRRWLDDLSERARNAVDATAIIRVVDGKSRGASNLDTVLAVRAELAKLIEHTVAITYQAVDPLPELERLRDAGIAAMKPLGVGDLPNLDLVETDDFWIPDAA